MSEEKTSEEQVDISKIRINRWYLQNVTLDPQSLARSLPMSWLHAKSRVQTPSSASLGRLDTLPRELVDQILPDLDLRSLMEFAATSRRANALVRLLPEFRVIATHALDVLRLCLGIGSAAWTTCNTLYDLLRSGVCIHCRDFGRFIYLPTCVRLCFICVTERREYRLLTSWEFAGLHPFGRLHSAAHIRRITSIPGEYGRNRIRKAERVVYFDRRLAHAVQMQWYGLKHGAGADPDTKFKYQYDSFEDEPNRFVAVMLAPWIKDVKGAGVLDWGISCAGCEGTAGGLHFTAKFRSDDWRRIFSADMLQQHLKQCNGARARLGLERAKPG